MLRPGEQDSETLRLEIVELVKVAKGSVQAPKRIEVVDMLPMTPVGKPDKKALRAKYWAGEQRAV